MKKFRRAIHSPLITAERAMRLIPNSRNKWFDVPLSAAQLVVAVSTLTLCGVSSLVIKKEG